MARLAAITYDGLPISSGGAHTLRTRGFIAGLGALQSFVTAVSSDVLPELLVEILEGDRIPKNFTRALLSEFDSRFTRVRSREIGSHLGHQWTFDSSSLNGIIAQLERLRPIPHNGYGVYAAVVSATWNLVLTDLTSQPLPYQSKDDYLGFDAGCQQYLGCSFTYARISEKTTANLFLSLPFEEVNDEARRMANAIQSHFPTRLSTNHWKIWKLSKKGNSYVGRKIPSLI